MPTVSVYLPDGRYGHARERGLPLGALAKAVEQALRGASVDDWVARMRHLPHQTQDPVDTSALMGAYAMSSTLNGGGRLR